MARAAGLAQASGAHATAPGQDRNFLRSLDGLPYDDGSKVVRVVAVRAGDTVAGLAGRMAYADHQRDRFAVLNGLDPDAPLAPGTLVKPIAAR